MEASPFHTDMNPCIEFLLRVVRAYVVEELGQAVVVIFLNVLPVVSISSCKTLYAGEIGLDIDVEKSFFIRGAYLPTFDGSSSCGRC